MKHFLRTLALALVLAGIPAASQAQQRGLTVHGYLTQGYADATDLPIYGIGTGGTTDYRALALQFRHGIGSNSSLVAQLSHRRLGTSAIQATEPDVALDWGFFQTRLEGFSIRAGKVPMPRGLFNEVRDVGVILPFFRASKAFYSEGVETIDGLSVRRNFDIGGGFGFEGTAYTGEFTTQVEFVGTEGLEVLNDRLSDAVGLHGQVSTPVPGLRFTGDYIFAEYDDASDFALWTASGDYSGDRVFARAEYQLVDISDPAGADQTEYLAWYAQAGFGVTSKLWVNAQYEANDITAFQALPSPPFPSPELQYDNIRDVAVGLLYQFSPMLVLKAEYHDFEGYQLDVPTLPLDPGTGAALPPGETQYFIVSVSAAF